MSNDKMRVSLSNDSIRLFAVPRDLCGRVFQNRQSEPSSRASSSDRKHGAQGCVRWVDSRRASCGRHSVLGRAPKQQACSSPGTGEPDRLQRDEGSLTLALEYHQLCTEHPAGDYPGSDECERTR